MLRLLVILSILVYTTEELFFGCGAMCIPVPTIRLPTFCDLFGWTGLAGCCCCGCQCGCCGCTPSQGSNGAHLPAKSEGYGNHQPAQYAQPYYPPASSYVRPAPPPPPQPAYTGSSNSYVQPPPPPPPPPPPSPAYIGPSNSYVRPPLPPPPPRATYFEAPSKYGQIPASAKSGYLESTSYQAAPSYGPPPSAVPETGQIGQTYVIQRTGVPTNAIVDVPVSGYEVPPGGVAKTRSKKI